MTGTPTPKWAFPTYDGTEPGSLKTIANAQANAAEAAMNAASPGFFLRYATRALMNANTTAATGQHATVYADSTITNNGDYVRMGGAWVISPYDTGWVTPALSGGYTGNSLVVRRIGNQVFWRGSIVRTSNWQAGNVVPIASLAAQFQPGGTWAGQLTASSETSWARASLVNGTLTFTPNAALVGTNNPVFMSQLNYLID